MSRILLAPMEGLADPLMRDVLTALGGYDWGICEFVRVTESVLPNRTFLRTCPELLQASHCHRQKLGRFRAIALSTGA